MKLWLLDKRESLVDRWREYRCPHSASSDYGTLKSIRTRNGVVQYESEFAIWDCPDCGKVLATGEVEDT